MTDNMKVTLKALLVMILWGSLFPMVKLGYSAFEIDTSSVSQILLFAGIRFTICGLAISGFAIYKNNDTKENIKASISAVLLTGLFSIILHYTCTYICLSLVDSSKTAILKQLGALIYICFGFLLFKDEKFSILKIIGAFIGFTGIIVINFTDGILTFSMSDLLIILASFCTVAGSITSKSAMKRVSAITVTGISQLFGGIVLVMTSVCMGVEIPTFSWTAMPILAYICVASVFSYCLWNYIIKTSKLSNMFLIKFTEPMFACVFGALILGENIFKWQYLLSFVLIATGIIVGSEYRSPKSTFWSIGFFKRR